MNGIASTIKDFATSLNGQHENLAKVNNSVVSINEDIDFLRESVLGKTSGSSILEALKKGIIRPKGESEQRKLELSLRIEQFGKTATGYIGGARTVLRFAENLKAAGLPISEADIAQATVTSRRPSIKHCDCVAIESLKMSVPTVSSCRALLPHATQNALSNYAQKWSKWLRSLSNA